MAALKRKLTDPFVDAIQSLTQENETIYTAGQQESYNAYWLYFGSQRKPAGRAHFWAPWILETARFREDLRSMMATSPPKLLFFLNPEGTRRKVEPGQTEGRAFLTKSRQIVVLMRFKYIFF